MIARLVLAAFVLDAACAAAQDRREVVEPRVPPVCRSLAAAPGDGDTPSDTGRIQAAIDACAAGTAVELRADGAHRLFVSAPLEFRRGITLLVSAGVVLTASRNPRDYDVRPGSCGIVDDRGGGCRPLVRVADAPDAAIMGEGAIDGRGGGALAGQRDSWWDLAQQAKVKKAHQNVPRLVVADRADNFVLYRITLRNSPNFHVVVSRTHGFTAWGVRIDAPKTARNTDGIDPASSTDVTIVHSFVRCGADNGLRIKSNRSRGSLVAHVRYREVCLRDVKNPIVLDREYDGVKSGPLEPRYEDIRYEQIVIGDAAACAGRFVPFPERP